MEAYAIVYAHQNLRPYLYRAEFMVYRDHKPIFFLFSKKNVTDIKIQRWAILLAEYGATMKYRHGHNNIRADMLSRIAPATVTVIDTANEYTDPPSRPADIADDLSPFNMDGLDQETLLAEQQAGFPDL